MAISSSLVSVYISPRQPDLALCITDLLAERHTFQKSESTVRTKIRLSTEFPFTPTTEMQYRFTTLHYVWSKPTNSVLL